MSRPPTLLDHRDGCESQPLGEAASTQLCKNLTVIEAVLFDLDGTLIDHRQAMLEAVAGLIAAFPGAEAAPSVLRETWRELERHHMQRYLAGECTFAEQRRQRVREFLPHLNEGVPSDDAGLDGWFALNYLGAYEAAWHCYPDVEGCLQELTSLNPVPLLAVVTNGDFDQQMAKLERVCLLPRLGRVLTPGQLGASKPDSACFATACEQLGVTSERTAYVGDWLEGDALAASEAGLFGIWLDRGIEPVNGGPTSPDDCTGMPVIRITSLGELPHLIDSRILGRARRGGQ
jgi:HAD superfamily hydrolase (TIGR01549 family)